MVAPKSNAWKVACVTHGKRDTGASGEYTDHSIHMAGDAGDHADAISAAKAQLNVVCGRGKRMRQDETKFQRSKSDPNPQAGL